MTVDSHSHDPTIHKEIREIIREGGTDPALAEIKNLSVGSKESTSI